MTKEELIIFIEKGLSSRAISKEIGKAQTTVAYWIRKYDLKTSHPHKKNKQNYPPSTASRIKCIRCNKNKLTKHFYKKKSTKGYHSYCKVCLNTVTVERLQKIKIDCIEYKGGACICCGYNKYFGALEFHHKNPKEKDFSISKTSLSFLKLKKELDKCVLVCSNCHREIHAGIIIIK